MTDPRRHDERARAEEYITQFAGHPDGIVLSQPKSGVFVERPMTQGELAAREVAANIAIDIYRHANQAGVCYYEIWEAISKAIDERVAAERARCAKVCRGLACDEFYQSANFRYETTINMCAEAIERSGE